MAGEIFRAELTGQGGDAKCMVRKSADGYCHIYNVTPPLPDGQYGLLVNGLVLKALCANGKWKQAED